MQIKFFCPKWGAENITWDNFAGKVSAAGFDGIETPVPFEQASQIEIIEALNKHDLLLIGQYYQSFEKDFDLHKQNFIKQMESLAALNPLLIDSQTGKDYFTANQNKELFEAATQITAKTGVVIAHETHRNKALFAAHIAKDLLVNNPGINITADFSHWCNVSESLLEQQEEAMDIAISKTVHIHARVGHAESAQVSDPRAPEWSVELAAHLSWWDKIVNHHITSGSKRLTITPEFGPAPYMPALPHTKNAGRKSVGHQCFYDELAERKI